MCRAFGARQHHRFNIPVLTDGAISLRPFGPQREHIFLSRVESRMNKRLLIIAVTALFILHQDIWFWRTARPLVFGFIPIGLFYHACFTVAASFVFWMLVKHAWPAHLEQEVEQSATTQNRVFEHEGEEDQAI
jgi:hypothetical protein